MIKKILLLLIGCLIITASVFVNSTTVTAQSQSSDRVPGQALVKFKNGTSQTIVNAELKKQKGKIVDQINGINTLVVEVPNVALDKVIEALSKNPHVEYAEENSLATALNYPVTAPDDTYFAANQWGLENNGQTIVNQTGTVDADIDAQAAWYTTTGTSASGVIKAAILDTGIDASHPELSSKIDLAKDFTGSTTSTDDIYGHGTHVSGIVAAETNNSIGVSGTCPDCRLLIGKVLNDSGSGAYSWIANGIMWAADNQAKVINMSLGGSSKSRTLENAVNYAWKKGVVVVAAAGNSANPSKTYPGAYTNVIAVAATDNNDKKASFSSYGSWVDVAAPGVNIFSTFPTHTFTLGTQYGRSQNYDYASGTSMSTPIVTATVALIWSTPYGTSNTAVRSRLESTSDRIPGTGSYWAKGRINAGKAVTP